jgi:serine/threonine-protein kinase PknG
VRRIGDDDSVLFGTPGYQAPELATGPSIGSDLYTVGRTLAVLSFDFAGFSTDYAHRLPDPGEVELLDREESYYRFLRRATHPDPRRASLGRRDGRPAPRRAAGGPGRGGRRAASGRLDPVHPGAGVFGTADADLAGRRGRGRAARSVRRPDRPGRRVPRHPQQRDRGRPAAAPVQSIEVRLQLIRALIDAGDSKAAAAELRVLPDDGTDWRLHWYAGLIALTPGRPDRADHTSTPSTTRCPASRPPGSGLAAACELAGDRAGAARRYERVWRVDHAFVSAAFGLSRMRLAVATGPAPSPCWTRCRPPPASRWPRRSPPSAAASTTGPGR